MEKQTKPKWGELYPAESYWTWRYPTVYCNCSVSHKPKQKMQVCTSHESWRLYGWVLLLNNVWMSFCVRSKNTWLSMFLALGQFTVLLNYKIFLPLVDGIFYFVMTGSVWSEFFCIAVRGRGQHPNLFLWFPQVTLYQSASQASCLPSLSGIRWIRAPKPKVSIQSPDKGRKGYDSPSFFNSP